MANKRKNSEYNRALEIAEAAKNSDLLKVNSYMLLPIEERFSKLMHLYDEMERWKKEYKKVEKHKPEDIRTPLTAERIEELIDSALYDEMIEVTLSMHVSNRIAHTCIFAKEYIIKKFILDKIENGQLEEKIDLDKALKRIDIISDPINTEESMITKISKAELKSFGITEEMLRELQGKGLKELSQLERSAFYIKTYETENTIKLLKKRDDISYGKVTNETGDALVIDLPYYGQFAVHLKSKESVSALSNTPYDSLHFYEKESVMLTDEISEKAQRFINSRRENGKLDLKDLIPELRKIKKDRPRFAHYVAVKMGATKQELDELYKDESKSHTIKNKPSTQNKRRKRKSNNQQRNKTKLNNTQIQSTIRKKEDIER